MYPYPGGGSTLQSVITGLIALGIVAGIAVAIYFAYKNKQAKGRKFGKKK